MRSTGLVGDIQRMKVVFEKRSERSDGVSHINMGKKSGADRQEQVPKFWSRNVPAVLERQQQGQRG